MTINFTDLKIKATPAGNQGMTVSLAESDPTIVNPTEQENVLIDVTKLNSAEKATVNAFIALMKSKL